MNKETVMYKGARFFRNAGAKIAAGVATLGASVGPAMAQSTFLTDAQDAITGAKTDALSVGGYVVVAIAGLVVVTLVIGMIRKL